MRFNIITSVLRMCSQASKEQTDRSAKSKRVMQRGERGRIGCAQVAVRLSDQKAFRWLFAAAKDRLLMARRQPQLFGIQCGCRGKDWWIPGGVEPWVCPAPQGPVAMHPPAQCSGNAYGTLMHNRDLASAFGRCAALLGL